MATYLFIFYLHPLYKIFNLFYSIGIILLIFMTMYCKSVSQTINFIDGYYGIHNVAKKVSVILKPIKAKLKLLIYF